MDQEIALVLTKIGGWVFQLLLGGFLLLFPNPSRIISRKEKQTRYFGHIDVFVTSSAFVLAMALILQGGIPRFAQLSSAMFGLFYCGYFPSFWVKLRCGLAAPALNNSGILDRVGSYIFTGPLAYSFVKYGLPLFGV